MVNWNSGMKLKDVLIIGVLAASISAAIIGFRSLDATTTMIDVIHIQKVSLSTVGKDELYNKTLDTLIAQPPISIGDYYDLVAIYESEMTEYKTEILDK
tara:strand:+ start:409 stop:705 length:297 start_codon:yes stop_codon:yes gene_type:complete